MIAIGQGIFTKRRIVVISLRERIFHGRQCDVTPVGSIAVGCSSRTVIIVIEG